MGDEIVVKVLSFDKEKPRVSLGLKQLSGDPWYEIIKKHPVGSRLFGRVTNIEEYGCFIEIKEGIEGLVQKWIGQTKTYTQVKLWKLIKKLKSWFLILMTQDVVFLLVSNKQCAKPMERV